MVNSAAASASFREVMSSHLVLVGLPGAGKTTLGRALSIVLERSFFDLDSEIERSFGLTVPEIFSTKGEPTFRAAEAEVSQRLAPLAPAVVASGGGWAANRIAVAHLRSMSRIIYLRVSPEEALRRMGAEIAGRPLFSTGCPEAVMRDLYEARRGYYEEVADLMIDANALSTDELVTMIVKRVQGLLNE